MQFVPAGESGTTPMNGHDEERESRFALCIRNDDEADLEVRKVYEVLPDAEGERLGLIRVIDESGEDYLYPMSFFHELDLSPEAEAAVRRSS